MIYPVSTSIHLFFDTEYKVSLNEQTERHIKAGFKYLDFNFLDWNADIRSPFVGDDWERWIDGAGETAAKYGVSFNQAHAPVYNGVRFKGCTDDNIREYIRRSIKACAMLKIPQMVHHAIYTSNSEWLKINHSIFDEFVELSAKYGVGIDFENCWVSLEDVPLSYTETLIDFVDSFGDPIVGICWDTGHCNMTGGKGHLKNRTNQYTEITKLGKRLRALHIDDNNGCIDDHVAPFDGIIDWDSVMRALADIGYEHSFTYEAHNAVRRLPESMKDEKTAFMYRLACELTKA